VSAIRGRRDAEPPAAGNPAPIGADADAGYLTYFGLIDC
jgi:hypothetical protein